MFKKRIILVSKKTQAFSKKSWRSFSALVGRRPFASFLIAFGILIGLIVLNSLVGKNKTTTATVEPISKSVEVYTIGTAPFVKSQAQVKKTGVVSIYAQSAGVIQKVFKKEGEKVSKGSQLAWISTNYTGGTLSSVQRQQAQTSYTFTKDNLDANKNLIAEQRSIAQTGRDNTEQLRSITDKSVQETSDLISLNNTIMSRVNDSITLLQNISAPSDAEKTQLTQLLSQKAQLQATLNQLNSGLRSTQYQVTKENPPTLLADEQFRLTNQQLDLQEKSLDLQEKLGQLSLRAAQIGESLNYPASPYKGTVERIAVVPGQAVNPGDLLAVVQAATTSATLEVNVPRNIALQIAPGEPSIATINNSTVSLLPIFISSQPTNGSLFTIKYQLPDALVPEVSTNTYVSIDLPIGIPMTTSGIPFVPIDALFQTQDGGYVYVVKTVDGKTIASAKKITLGEVIGNYVTVSDGLTTGDQVIIDRTVLEGDLISIK